MGWPAAVAVMAPMPQRGCVGYRTISSGLACWQTVSPAVWLTMSSGSAPELP